MSKSFGATLRDGSGSLESSGGQLLIRGGFVRQLGQGIFSYLPLGLRVLRRIESIMRQELNAEGGEEISLPLVHPAEIWRESGRWETIGAELVRLKDRRGRDLVLAMTHEEVVASLAESEINSWRDLPRLVYQIQLKFRDDPRPRAGLIRTREFTMNDGYSLDRNAGGLDEQYSRMSAAYGRIFSRCGLPVIAVGADVGMMGGSEAHEFMYLTPIGEDTIVFCDRCGYAQNRQVAKAAKRTPVAEEQLAIERVETPGASTIEALAVLLSVPLERTTKVVFFAAALQGSPRTKFLVAVVRGDTTVNETKLASAVDATELRPMTVDEIDSIGCVAGYASPVAIADHVLVVVDDLVAAAANLVAGANEEGVHLRNVNVGRDYVPDVITDIAAVDDGDPCSICGDPLRTTRGVEVGNIFKLGTKFSIAAGANFTDDDGTEKPIVMGSYGIGVGRLMACIAEEHHDEKGLCWPTSIAPFDVHLCVLGNSSISHADALYEELQLNGIEVLMDDRGERAGVQFAEADLIGIPLRIVVSPRSLELGGMEVKRRSEQSASVIARDQITQWVQANVVSRLNEPSAR